MGEEQRGDCCRPPADDIAAALTREEKKARDYILTFISQYGSVPGPEAIQAALGLPSVDQASWLLASLEGKGILYRDPRSRVIVSAYPLSLMPTEHVVTLSDGRKVYAMCALDSLGIPLTFAKDATIRSVCHHCRRPATIRIGAGKVAAVDPASTIVWPNGVLGDVWAEKACPFINFFCSQEHLARWKAESGTQDAGLTMTVDQAMDRAREIFGKSIGE